MRSLDEYMKEKGLLAYAKHMLKRAGDYIMTNKATYRKLNDLSLSTSTYHKKDGTPVRAILKEELNRLVDDELESKEFDLRYKRI